MFVASSLYSYGEWLFVARFSYLLLILRSCDRPATGSSIPPGKEGATPANSRVKRHPIRKRNGHHDIPTSPPPSYASVASGRSSPPLHEPSASIHEQLANEEAARHRSAAELAKILVIDAIVKEEDLYKVLAVKRNAKAEEIRRGFLNRSRVCHPE